MEGTFNALSRAKNTYLTLQDLLFQWAVMYYSCSANIVFYHYVLKFPEELLSFQICIGELDVLGRRLNVCTKRFGFAGPDRRLLQKPPGSRPQAARNKPPGLVKRRRAFWESA
jgi:hypothetical protein